MCYLFACLLFGGRLQVRPCGEFCILTEPAHLYRGGIAVAVLGDDDLGVILFYFVRFNIFAVFIVIGAV